LCDSRPGHTEDTKSDCYGLSSLVLGINLCVQEEFTGRSATES